MYELRAANDLKYYKMLREPDYLEDLGVLLKHANGVDLHHSSGRNHESGFNSRANRQPLAFCHHSIVRAKPSSNSSCGSQSRISRARVMSGTRRLVSSNPGP